MSKIVCSVLNITAQSQEISYTVEHWLFGSNQSLMSIQTTQHCYQENCQMLISASHCSPLNSNLITYELLMITYMLFYIYAFFHLIFWRFTLCFICYKVYGILYIIYLYTSSIRATVYTKLLHYQYRANDLKTCITKSTFREPPIRSISPQTSIVYIFLIPEQFLSIPDTNFVSNILR